MDILSHGLWAGAAAKGINLKKERKLNVWWTAFWGVFPDLFAFTIPFAWLLFNLATGNVQFSDLHRPTGAEPDDKFLFGNGDARQAQSAIAYLTSSLYNISHSLIVFLFIFGLIILARRMFKKENVVMRETDASPRRRGPLVPWEMSGWLLHIILDVPTHSYAFYPTPIFWPLSGWKFQGFAWANPWFMAVNISAIAITYLVIRRFEKKKIIS